MPETKININNSQINKAKEILSVLKKSVDNVLEKKKQLGQYAVIEKQGKIIKLSFKN